MIQAFKVASWIVANWKTVAILIGANWETIALIIGTIVQAQKTFTENADKKAWVVETLVPQVKRFTPDQIDEIIDKLVDVTKLLGWLPAKKGTL